MRYTRVVIAWDHNSAELYLEGKLVAEDKAWSDIHTHAHAQDNL